VGREQVERSLVGDFAERAFQGSLPRLVVQALSATGTSPEEITRIRALLDRLESER
jgi:predicted transcriptional regulator